VKRVLRALPTLLRVAFVDVLAYRAEMIVWVLATTMPLVMMMLFTTVAKDGPVGRYGERAFVAYFLATFIARQITGSWISWQINFEVRQGTLAMRLLRPIHPLIAYSAESAAAVPFRVMVSIPVMAILLLSVGDQLARDPVQWLLFVPAVVGGWLITLLVNLALGSLAFFLESSMKLMDVWLALFFVFSGYMIPVDLFPAGLREVVDHLPFRFQIALPVELMTGALGTRQALYLVAHQWLWVWIAFVVARFAWARGVARFAAFGG
jgi:ABC-2 type transport system permease protein